MSQLEADREQQRLDAIMSRRAMGLYSSSGGTRTRAAAATTTPPKWAAPVATTRMPSTAPKAPTAAAATTTIGTGACALTTALSPSPPPVPPRSPVMAPPPVPPRSPLLEPTTPPSAEKAVAIDDSEATPCDDQAYRAKCEKQRLDKYISGEWRLARLLRADSGVTKTKSSSSDAEAAERQRERDHKETCDLATKQSRSVDTLETELILVSLFIDELVHLLHKATATTTAGYDNAQALSIARKAKEVKDAAVNIITAFTLPSTSTARISDDVNALAGTIARLVNGWREGAAVDEEAAGSVASQAAQLQHQLRQLALAQ